MACLNIRKDACASRLPLARRRRAPARSGHHPVSQGAVARRPRLRRRVQRRRQPGDCFGLKTGVATAMVDNGIGELVQARIREIGVRPFYKQFKHDGVRGPEHRHGVQRPRPRRAGAGGVLQPRQRSRRAAQAGRLRLGRRSSPAACAGSTRAASSRRSRRRRRELIIEGMQAAKAAGAVTLVRPQLPRQAVGRLGGGAKGQEVFRSIVAQRRRADRQRGRPADGPRHRRARSGGHSVEARPRALLHDDRPRARGIPQRQAGRHDAPRSALDQPPRLGAPCCGSTARSYVSPTMQLDVLDRIGGGDGFAAGLIYGLHHRPLAGRGACGSAGPTARCSRRSPATSRWPSWPRSKRWPRAARRVQR